jgi:hypothetical protein
MNEPIGKRGRPQIIKDRDILLYIMGSVILLNIREGGTIIVLDEMWHFVSGKPNKVLDNREER